ncbi:protein of unknown function [Catalinimonas alkaloidigena]|uniref:DUF4136 domain-containing protein n=1 Tax=Catalinimonas alkaloidigena TaxID=1075417 RepID=A0A1G9A971_9BACT|nr:DUF4136 domain-containing protein [Catalinimonas alkaloidigena]SDK23000.1 protein of unknown function [Catalinimonas alkaloidigena]
MRYLKNLVWLLPVALLLASCGTRYMASADWDRSVNLRDFSTYRIVEKVEGEKVPPLDPILNSPFNQARIETAVKAQLNSRGFHEDETPDVLVKFFTYVKDRQETRSYGNTSPFMWWYGGNANTYSRNYEESTLIVELYDARTNKLVWQGWAIGEANRSGKNQDAKTGEQVSRIFQNFPVERQGNATDPMAYH